MSRAMLLLLLGAVAFVSTVQSDTQAGEGDNNTAMFAAAFESVADGNTTGLLDEIVVPASLESEKMVLPPMEEELRPHEPSTTGQLARSLTSVVPYGGALVAVEATALLVGGATIVVLLIAKVKTRHSVAQYEYDEVDPMLQSLLYSDMDYAAI